MADINDDNDQCVILEARNNAIVADAKAPLIGAPDHASRQIARRRMRSDPIFKKINNSGDIAHRKFI